VITIPARFNGPPTSGHGGYSCGIVAEFVDAGVKAATLRVPPPLDRELVISRGADGAVALLDGDALVAEAVAVEPLALDVPAALSPDDAEAVARSIEWDVGLHPFPTCFGCGPLRDRDEAIRLLPGRVPDREDPVFADSWTPPAEFADDDGVVLERFVWAALDCPTAAAAVPLGDPPHVLGRLTAAPALAPLRAGVRHAVVSWLVDIDGRKRRGGCAIFDGDGQLCALGEGLWIAVRDPAAFAAQGA
jgi:hypothetical protein